MGGGDLTTTPDEQTHVGNIHRMSEIKDQIRDVEKEKAFIFKDWTASDSKLFILQ